MRVLIHPGRVQNGHVLIPPSKSMAHRAILCAALAKGTSVISNLDYSEDIQATLSGLRQLGAQIEQDQDRAIIHGITDLTQVEPMTVFCNESGSTLRFLIPLFSLTGKRIRFTGKNRLLQRPQTLYEELFHQQGNHFVQNEEAIEIEGALQPGTLSLRGNVSSQFISGLFFSLPLCFKDSRLLIEPPFESRSYAEMTIEMLQKFGISIYSQKENSFWIPGNQHYSPHDEQIEGDYSQFAFFAALGALNQDMECHGLRLDSKQGDRRILHYLKAMGAKIQVIPEGYRIQQSPLHGTRIDLSDCPDLGPILMVLATFAQGTTVIEHAGRLRLKESDRIAAMESELKKVGANVSSTEETVTICGPTVWKGGITLSGHRDHRIVMSLAIGATMAEQPIWITEAQSIAKSYPGFFRDLAAQEIEVEELDA